jgi:hypothetical protein
VGATRSRAPTQNPPLYMRAFRQRRRDTHTLYTLRASEWFCAEGKKEEKGEERREKSLVLLLCYSPRVLCTASSPLE